MVGYCRSATKVHKETRAHRSPMPCSAPCSTIYVALDDTGLDGLDKSRETGKFRAHLWCFSGTTP